MSNFVLNVASGENYFSQWQKYVQQRELYSDITSAIQSQTKTYQTEINKASKAVSSSIDIQTRAIGDAAGAVIGELGEGFSDLSAGLSQINTSINQLAMMLDWRLAEMTDQQRISNLLLEDIALLLRIPDVQKERQYHIEQGFKHYMNTALDEDLYQDALENLLEAEKREKTDYVILHRIGMIYLYSPKLLDTARAELYFRRAAKYAVVESDPKAHRVFDILAGEASKLGEQCTATDKVKAVAAESFFQASVACYAQAKFGDTVDLARKSFSLLPSLLEAGFIEAKALTAGGSDSQAVDILHGIIEAEPFYAVKTATDGDLAPNSRVQTLLLKFRDDTVKRARHDLDTCKASMISGSEAAPLIDAIEDLVRRNTYFDALNALYELSRERAWKEPYLWNTSNKLVATLKEHTSSVYACAFSPDGLLFATGGHDKTCLWHGKTPQLIRTLDSGSTLGVVFSFDSKTLTTVHSRSERPVVVWDVETGESIVTLEGVSASAVALSPDGELLATGHQFWVELRDATSKEHIGYVTSSYPYSLAFNSNGSLLAAGCPRTAEILNVASGQRMHSPPHTDRVNSVAFSPTSALLATGSDDKTVRIWNSLTCELIHTLNHTRAVSSVAFSPDGMVLATSTWDGVWLWDPKTWLLIQGFEHRGCQSLAFSPHGTSIVFADRTSEVWTGPYMSIESFVTVEELAKEKAREAHIRKESDERLKQQAAEERRRQANISDLIARAQMAEEQQNKKWFRKNYSEALALYDQAAALGSEAAIQRIRELKNKRS